MTWDTLEPWMPDPEARVRTDEANVPEQVCECGHPDWQHTQPEGHDGDCMHVGRTPISGFKTYDCECPSFRPKEDS